jgi:hypothetical protein
MRSIQRRYDPDSLFGERRAIKRLQMAHNKKGESFEFAADDETVDSAEQCEPKQCSGVPLIPDSTTACDDGRQRAVRCEPVAGVCRWRVLDDQCIGSPVLRRLPPTRSTATVRPLVGVVIAGQLSRVELASKLRHLVGHNVTRDDVDLALFVVVSASTPTYSEQTLVAAHHYQGTLDELFRQLSAATPWPIVAYSYDQRRERALRYPLRPTTFWRRYDRRHVATLTHQISSNVAQYDVLARAATLIETFERQTGRQLDAVLRLRDDALLLDRFDLAARLRQLSLAHASVLAPNCARWGGVNDQLYLVQRHCMSAALRSRLRLVSSAVFDASIGSFGNRLLCTVVHVRPEVAEAAQRRATVCSGTGAGRLSRSNGAAL